MQQEVDVNPFSALGPGLVTYEWKTQILSIHLFFAESGLEPDRRANGRGYIYTWKQKCGQKTSEDSGQNKLIAISLMFYIPKQ